jgi:uncharacterized protein (TIGR02145 family)
MFKHIHSLDVVCDKQGENAMKKVIILLVLFSTAVFAQQKGSFTDQRDKKIYKTVKIGKQTWMAENLNYHGEGGDLGVCYDKKQENCKKYGRLYSWSEAMDVDKKFNGEKWNGSDVKHKGVCPVGWHLPNKEEWQALADFAGGNEIAGKKLKSKTGWKEHDELATDALGFSALPGGLGNSGYFDYVGSHGRWWSASEYVSSNAYDRYMYYNNDGAYWYDVDKFGLHSIRCVVD